MNRTTTKFVAKEILKACLTSLGEHAGRSERDTPPELRGYHLIKLLANELLEDDGYHYTDRRKFEA